MVENVSTTQHTESSKQVIRSDITTNNSQIDGVLQIFGVSAHYLIDTGAIQTFMRESIYEKLRDKVTLNAVNLTFASCTGHKLDLLGSFVGVIELGDYVTKSPIDIYVVRNFSISNDVILGRDFIAACPLLKPGLELMKQIAKETTQRKIKFLENKNFNIDLLIREFSSLNPPLTHEIETKLPSVCSYSSRDLGRTDLIKFKIDLMPDAQPIRTPYRHIKPQYRDEVIIS